MHVSGLRRPEEKEGLEGELGGVTPVCEWAGGGRAGDTASFLRITELWKALINPERQVFSKRLLQMSSSSLVSWGVYLSRVSRVCMVIWSYMGCVLFGVIRRVYDDLQLHGGVWGGGGQECSPGDSACSSCGERRAGPGRSSERPSRWGPLGAHTLMNVVLMLI